MKDIEKQKAIESYRSGSKETKKALIDIFGKDYFLIPNLDDYTSIKTYEDACEALDEEPVLSGSLEIFHNGYKLMDMPPHIIALMKLETISRALWGRTWKPYCNASNKTHNHFPVFQIYNQSKMCKINDNELKKLLFFRDNDGVFSGFGYLHTLTKDSGIFVHDNILLYQENFDKSKYFGEQFLELWAEYFRFKYKFGERVDK